MLGSRSLRYHWNINEIFDELSRLGSTLDISDSGIRPRKK